MINPYEVLGVPRDATDEQIKSAWKMVAMRLHPDKGGDESEFNAARLSKDVILDADRRSRFDRTGEIDDEAAVNPNVAVIAVIMPIIVRMAEQYANGKRPNPADVDWVSLVKDVLQRRIIATERDRKSTDVIIKHVFSQMVKKTACSNILMQVLKREAETNIDSEIDAEIANIRLAIKLLDDLGTAGLLR